MHVYIYTYILLLYTITGPSLLLLLLLLTLWSFLLLSWFGVFVPYYCYWYDFYYSSAYYYHHYHCLYSSLFICLFIVYNIVCLLLLNLIDWYVFIAQCSTIYIYTLYTQVFLGTVRSSFVATSRQNVSYRTHWENDTLWRLQASSCSFLGSMSDGGRENARVHSRTEKNWDLWGRLELYNVN